jgi:hypothetical protein
MRRPKQQPLPSGASATPCDYRISTVLSTRFRHVGAGFRRAEILQAYAACGIGDACGIVAAFAISIYSNANSKEGRGAQNLLNDAQTGRRVEFRVLGCDDVMGDEWRTASEEPNGGYTLSASPSRRA